MWSASTRSLVLEIQKYLNQVRSSFLQFFHRCPVSSGSESVRNACILMSFGPCVECWTTCAADAVRAFCVECWTMLPWYFAKSKPPVVLPRCQTLLVVRYNIHVRYNIPYTHFHNYHPNYHSPQLSFSHILSPQHSQPSFLPTPQLPTIPHSFHRHV